MAPRELPDGDACPLRGLSLMGLLDRRRPAGDPVEEGKALFDRGSYEAAIDAYDRALDGGIDEALASQVLVMRGLAQEELGRWTDLLVGADRAVALDAANEWAHYQRGL